MAVPAGRAGGQHCDESVATGSCQVTFARLVLAWTMTAARVDNSRQRHQASETTGQTQAAVTTRDHRSEASAAPTRDPPAPCSTPHRPSSSAPTGRGDFLLRMASRGRRADRLLTWNEVRFMTSWMPLATPPKRLPRTVRSQAPAPERLAAPRCSTRINRCVSLRR